MTNKQKRNWLVIGLMLIVYAISEFMPQSSSSSVDNAILEQAIINQKSDVQVQVTAPVIKLLRDDTTGSQHQRFLIKLTRGDTILIAHNIDLAPRVEHLKVGDTVSIYGEYEWNKKGGVIHWTHHDPANRHPSGWIKHRGKTYQ